MMHPIGMKPTQKWDDLVNLAKYAGYTFDLRVHEDTSRGWIYFFEPLPGKILQRQRCESLNEAAAFLTGIAEALRVTNNPVTVVHKDGASTEYQVMR